MSSPAPPLPALVAARFAAETVAAGTPGWWPAAELSHGRLAAAVAAERAARGAPSDAVAGSLLVLGYSRLLGWPVLGGAVQEGRWPDPALTGVSVRAERDRVIGVGFPDAAPRGGDVGRALAALLDEHLDPLVAAVHALTRAPLRVLWSNVAAALAGALLALSWTLPERAGMAAPTRSLLDAEPRLRGLVTVAVSAQGGEDWMRVVRRGCCLAFRCAPPHGHWCGTCPVLDEAERERRFQEAAARYRVLEAWA
ncbi:IucA/IucC family C-terminal-domain containing protein [Pseudonocardia sp.]|uniref:IucA/IucC family C-terminal-domain containing protein n=1 Tax=Pseudonocardia sp. TaxID=60912 RepID=UPI003D0E055A